MTEPRDKLIFGHSMPAPEAIQLLLELMALTPAVNYETKRDIVEIYAGLARRNKIDDGQVPQVLGELAKLLVGADWTIKVQISDAYVELARHNKIPGIVPHVLGGLKKLLVGVNIYTKCNVATAYALLAWHDKIDDGQVPQVLGELEKLLAGANDATKVSVSTAYAKLAWHDKIDDGQVPKVLGALEKLLAGANDATKQNVATAYPKLARHNKIDDGQVPQVLGELAKLLAGANDDTKQNVVAAYALLAQHNKIDDGQVPQVLGELEKLLVDANAGAKECIVLAYGLLIKSHYEKTQKMLEIFGDHIAIKENDSCTTKYSKYFAQFQLQIQEYKEIEDLTQIIKELLDNMTGAISGQNLNDVFAALILRTFEDIIQPSRISKEVAKKVCLIEKLEGILVVNNKQCIVEVVVPMIIGLIDQGLGLEKYTSSYKNLFLGSVGDDNDKIQELMGSILLWTNPVPMLQLVLRIFDLNEKKNDPLFQALDRSYNHQKTWLLYREGIRLPKILKALEMLGLKGLAKSVTVNDLIVKYLDASDFTNLFVALSQKVVYTLAIYNGNGNGNEPDNFNQIPSSYSNSGNSLYQKITGLLPIEAINWYVKQVVYHQDISKFSEILENYGIHQSIDVLRNDAEFKKTVLLKLHPDKGGKEEDFVFVQGLKEKISGNLDVSQLINDKFQAVHHTIYKANLGFKVLDSSTDVLRALHKPTAENITKAAIDCVYLFAAYQGIYWHVMLSSGAETAIQVYQGEYIAALQNLAVVSVYAILQTASYSASLPLIFPYEFLALGCTACKAIANAHEFYVEYYYEHEHEHVPDLDMS